jgi:acetoacetyl-CoA synthetase
MDNPFGEVQPLWSPSVEDRREANITHYMHWLESGLGLAFQSREALWCWSVEELEDFWSSLWNYFHIQASQAYTAVLVDRQMPGATWFPGAHLNYAEHVFRHANTQQLALLFQSERQPLTEISWAELQQTVGALAHSFRQLGVQPGDRVVAYMPNIPQTLMAFLACASIGAIWASCSPDFGIRSVIERFAQIEPTILLAVDGYQYHGKAFERLEMIKELQQALPTLKQTILVPYLHPDATLDGLSASLLWQDLVRQPAELIFEQVPFDHPLWILYSSGTTGMPKAIVQGHGGILLEHLKALTFDMNLKAGDRFFWFTTTGWMMWNLLLGGLLVNATAILYDGSPNYPDTGALWQFVQDSRMTCFGTSASYITSCMKSLFEPGQIFDLSALRCVGSTGSPLPPEGFHWLYEHVKRDLWIASISGGTDVCSAFVTGSIILPVLAGELQCRSLGAAVQAFDEQGQPLIDEVGELVITQPMPSMPLYFWNDPDQQRYQESYFTHYPGIWRHGDWISITTRGSAVIYGRSDSTINRMGIRMGSSEIYRVVESLPEVADSLIVGVELPHGKYYLPLFVVLRPDIELDEQLITRIKSALRTQISPHHVPDEILLIPEIPRTLSGKKLEVPVKRIFMGVPPEKAVSRDALSNPYTLAYILEVAQRIALKQIP